MSTTITASAEIESFAIPSMDPDLPGRTPGACVSVTYEKGDAACALVYLDQAHQDVRRQIMDDADDDVSVVALARDARKILAELQDAMQRACPGEHRLVQHRDGKPRRCPDCRRTDSGRFVDASGGIR